MAETDPVLASAGIHPPLNKDPPTASSSEEDEEGVSSGKHTASASDSESGSKAEKSIVPVPASKPKNKRPPSEVAPPQNRANSKRIKKGDGADSKKPAFQKLWSDEDEVTLLQGMIKFKKDTGKSPSDHLEFYEFIKPSISFEVSWNQLKDKIKNLRKKFIGKHKSFSQVHDQTCLALSKTFWGMCPANANALSKKADKVVEQDDWFENSSFVRSLGVDQQFFTENWILVPKHKQKEVEQELKDLRVRENELAMHKSKFAMDTSKLQFDVTSMLSEAYRS